MVVDEKLDEGRTDNNGRFRLSGSKYEFSNIDPQLTIYGNKCNYIASCFKTVRITIPDGYITKGPVPRYTYDIGTLNLARKEDQPVMQCTN
ncbi:Transthyretin-like family protein [Ostertagia ostertagi]